MMRLFDRSRAFARTRRGNRLSAVIAAGGVMVLAVAPVAAGVVGTTSAAGAPVAGIPQAPASHGSDELAIQVGKVVQATGTATGEITSAGFSTTTTVTGEGNSTVTVPAGPNPPVDTSAFSPLNVQDEAIVYDIQNSAGEVQRIVTSGGKFTDEMPYQMSVDVEVDGEKIDPEEAGDLTGDVKITYHVENNTATTGEVSYEDIQGKIQKAPVGVAVPFEVTFYSTFGAGWAEIVHPFANGGPSAGLTLSGGGIYTANAGNNWNPNGDMVLTAKAQNASLPAVLLSYIPRGANPDTQAALADLGATLDSALNGGVVPALLKVQAGLGKASVALDAKLTESVDPLLESLAQIELDPDNASNRIQQAGATLGGLAGALLSVNSTIEEGGARLGRALTGLTDEETEARLNETAETLEDLAATLEDIIPLLDRVSGALTSEQLEKLTQTFDQLLAPETVEGNMRARVANAVGSDSGPVFNAAWNALNNVFEDALNVAVECPTPANPGPPCLGQQSVASILDALLLQGPTQACEVGFDTKDLWDTGSAVNRPVQNALQAAIDAATPADKPLLTTLQNRLDAQSNRLAIADQASCLEDAQFVQEQVSGFFGSIGAIGESLGGLTPLLESLQSGAEDLADRLTELADNMPELRDELEAACPGGLEAVESCGAIAALDLVSSTNTDVATDLEQDSVEPLSVLEPVITQAFDIANLLGDAAPGIQQTLNELPGTISAIAYGSVDSFISRFDNLGAMGAGLADSASTAEAANRAMDAMYKAGGAAPYGNATGEAVTNRAYYTVAMKAPAEVAATNSTKAAFGGVVLLAGAGLGALGAARFAKGG